MSQNPSQSSSDDEAGKREWTNAEHVRYLLSLPERAVRSGTGVLGGMVRESAALLVPKAFKSSRTYAVTVTQTLDFLVHDVGGVAQGEQPSSTAGVENYVARKAVGNFVDLASLATLHVSPLMLLAAISDVAYGSRVYLKELSEELKAQGVIDENSHVDNMSDLLSAVSDATRETSRVFDTPPLSVEALKESIDKTTAAIRASNPAKLLSPEDIARMWEDMRTIAKKEGVGMLAVSGAATMRTLGKIGTLGQGALSTVKVAGSLLDQHVVDYYREAIGDIRSRGLYASLAETSEPYIAAVWQNFQPSKSTITEDLVSGKLIGSSWKAVRRWMGSDEGESQ